MFKLKIQNPEAVKPKGHSWGLLAISSLFNILPNLGQQKIKHVRVGYPGVKRYRIKRKIRNKIAAESRRINRV